MLNDILKNLALLKQTAPLINNIASPISGDFLLNGLLAIGSSSVTAYADEELEDLVSLSSAVVINTERLARAKHNTYSKALSFANAIGKPVILDPSGADLTPYRKGAAHQILLSHKIDIIRGTVSEIMAMSGQTPLKRVSIDSKHTQETLTSGKDLSHRHDMCVVMSGKEDVIIVHNRHRIFDYGHTLMPKISGIGCLLTSVLAAFHAVNKDAFKAASTGVVLYGMAGEIAAENASVQGPGTFKTAFLDSLHNLSEDEIKKRYRHA